MFDLLKAAVNFTDDVTKIVVAPAAVALNVARVATKPLAEVAQIVIEETRDCT